MRSPKHALPPGTHVPPQPPPWLASLQRSALAQLDDSCGVPAAAVHALAAALLVLPAEVMGQYHIPSIETATLAEAGGLAVLVKSVLEARLVLVNTVLDGLATLEAQVQAEEERREVAKTPSAEPPPH